jgi:hypothetical protein
MIRYIKLFEDFDSKENNLSYDELFIKLAWPKYYGEGTKEELRSIPQLEALLKSLPKPPIKSIPEDTRTEWGGVKLGESVSAEELPKIYERMGHYADDSTGKFKGDYKLIYVPVYEKLDKYRLSDDYEDLEHFDRVNEYADAIRSGKELPPIIYTSGLFRDGAHRNAAHVDVGRKKILCFYSKDNKFINESLFEDDQTIISPDYYLDDFYGMDGMDYYDEEEAKQKIQKVIDYVLSIQYPIKVYRGINTINPSENYAGGSWSTDIRVAEGFGDKIFVGMIHNKDVIDIEQTIRTRVMNPYEYEIYVPNFEDVEVIKTYNK